MHTHSATQLAIALLCTAGIVSGCSRKETTPPAAQLQSNSPVQTTNAPESVTGCLRAGEGPGTFVLTTSMAADGRAATTYQLAASGGANLSEHVGERVLVQGIVLSQQASTTATGNAPAANDRAKGTSGTPTVSTTTTLDLKRMDVTSVTRAEGKCDTGS